MRSPMIESADYIDKEDKQNYSDLKVMQSAAGFYIGTEYRNTEFGFEMIEPGSRDSAYYATEEEAQHALNTRTWIQRWSP